MAAMVAAYVGTVLLLTIEILWRDYFYSTGWDVGDLLMTFLGIIFLSLIAVWFVLPLTVPPALILGHLSPTLERSVSPADLRWIQFGSGAGAGFIVMLAFSYFMGEILEVREHAPLMSVAGLLAGLVAVRAFRRFRYGSPWAFRAPFAG